MQWVNDPAYFCGVANSIPGLAQLFKDLVLAQLWHRSQMWLRFDPRPRNLHMTRVWLKKGKKKKTTESKWQKSRHWTQISDCLFHLRVSPIRFFFFFFFFFFVGFESIYASFVGKFTYVHTVVFIFVSGPEWDQEKAANSLKLSQSSRISFFSSSL